MSVESQRSIADWRNSVFGPSEAPGPIVMRAFSEMIELIQLFACGPATVERIDDCAAEIVSCTGAEVYSADYSAVAAEMADVLIVLFGVADDMGIDLMAAVDKKMKINRNRKWNVTGPGQGQHIPE